MSFSLDEEQVESSKLKGAEGTGANQQPPQPRRKARKSMFHTLSLCGAVIAINDWQLPFTRFSTLNFQLATD